MKLLEPADTDLPAPAVPEEAPLKAAREAVFSNAK
jgi:hypothetical protein